MDKKTTVVILKSLVQILFYIDRLRYHIPEHKKSDILEKSRQDLYKEIRRLEQDNEEI